MPEGNPDADAHPDANVHSDANVHPDADALPIMRLVTLVGLPGAGKSTIGRQLARKRGLPFFDSDLVIEERLGETIRTFFAREGEAAFRDLEEQVIDELTLQGRCVLATGGGAVLRGRNRQHMRERGAVVYLRASPEQLMRRLRNDTKRPLLQVADPMARLQDLYEEREPLYKEVADFTFDACGTSPALLVSRVMMQLDLTCKSLPGSETG